MRFEFENFARAGTGIIELNDLTVICGPNNTGKTYINYAIFTILDRMEDYFDIGLSVKDAKKIHADLNSEGKSELSYSKERFLKNVFSNVQKEIVSNFHTYFGVPENNFSDLTISPNFFDFEFENKKKISAKDVFPGVVANITFENDIVLKFSVFDTKTFKKLQDELVNDYEYINEYISFIVYQNIFIDHILTPFPITSERTGISLFYKIFDERNQRIISNLDGKVRKIRRDENPELSKLRAEMSLPIHDNIGTIRRYGDMILWDSLFKKSAKKFKGVFTLLSELLDGGHFVSTNDAVMFHPEKNSKVKEPATPLHAASSSVKSLFLLDLYIKHLADKNQILIIDEPELNLYPVNQAKMANLVAKLVNAGIKILITTHSDHFIREINNLIALNSVKEDQEKLMKRFEIEKDELLEFDRVSAYNTTKEFMVEKMNVDKFGIETRILNAIIEEVNLKNNTILSYVEEDDYD